MAKKRMPKGLRDYWAKRRGRSRKGGSRMFSKIKRAGRKFTLPIAVVVGFSGPAMRVYGHYKSNGFMGEEGAIGELSRIMTGVNVQKNPATFEAWRLRYGLLPILLGLGVHKLANYIGINRMIAKAGIPVIRI